MKLYQTVVNHPNSKKYRDYVDRKHLWNRTTDGRTDWSFTDDGLTKKITGYGKTFPYLIKDLATGKSTKHKFRGSKYTYRVTKAKVGEKFGFDLAYDQLGIPNNSITIVDTDAIISKYFKKNTRNMNTQSAQDKNYTLYYFMNCVINGDSAGKTNPNNKHIFSNVQGINCEALINNADWTIRGNNNDIKMAYHVKCIPMGSSDVRQDWTKKATNHGASRGVGIKVGDKKQFDQANKNNNRPNVWKMAKKLIQRKTNLVDPNGRDWVDDSILSLMRKRSGDLFQGYLTKHLSKFNGTVLKQSWKLKLNSTRWESTPEAQNFNFQTFRRNGGNGDIFTTTGDYPYLDWCLENGVNVLFRAAGTQFVLYFRKI